jgi:hypothetical protein
MRRPAGLPRMAGRFPNNMNQHEEIILAWMERAHNQRNATGFEELHINRIDRNWREPRLWLQGGMKALQIAKRICKSNAYTVTVALAFSLRGQEKPLGLNFTSAEELELQLDQSPPALCLFNSGCEPWVSPSDSEWRGASVRSVLGIPLATSKSFYLEFKHPAVDGYSRTLVVISA